MKVFARRRRMMHFVVLTAVGLAIACGSATTWAQADLTLPVEIQIKPPSGTFQVGKIEVDVRQYATADKKNETAHTKQLTNLSLNRITLPAAGGTTLWLREIRIYQSDASRPPIHVYPQVDVQMGSGYKLVMEPEHFFQLELTTDHSKSVLARVIRPDKKLVVETTLDSTTGTATVWLPTREYTSSKLSVISEDPTDKSRQAVSVLDTPAKGGVYGRLIKVELRNHAEWEQLLRDELAKILNAAGMDAATVQKVTGVDIKTVAEGPTLLFTLDVAIAAYYDNPWYGWNPTIFINSRPFAFNNPEHCETLLHEWVHHLMQVVYASGKGKGKHAAQWLITDPETAWQEGVAHFLGEILSDEIGLGSVGEWRRDSALAVPAMTAAKLGETPGEKIEGVVASALLEYYRKNFSTASDTIRDLLVVNGTKGVETVSEFYERKRELLATPADKIAWDRLFVEYKIIPPLVAIVKPDSLVVPPSEGAPLAIQAELIWPLPLGPDQVAGAEASFRIPFVDKRQVLGPLGCQPDGTMSGSFVAPRLEANETRLIVEVKTKDGDSWEGRRFVGRPERYRLISVKETKRSGEFLMPRATEYDLPALETIKVDPRRGTLTIPPLNDTRNGPTVELRVGDGVYYQADRTNSPTARMFLEDKGVKLSGSHVAEQAGGDNDAEGSIDWWTFAAEVEEGRITGTMTCHCEVRRMENKVPIVTRGEITVFFVGIPD